MSATHVSKVKVVIDVTQHFGLVGYCLDRCKAAKWAQRGTLTRREDLEQAGKMGLMKAAEKFDDSRGIKFATYARWWIEAFIKNECYDKVRTVRIPRSSANKMWRAGDKIPQHAVSIETGFVDRENKQDSSVLDMLGVVDAQDDEKSDQDDLIAKLKRALASLPERDQAVLHGRYYDEVTLAKLSEELGLSRERVRQIQEGALQKLRSYFRAA